MASGVQVVGPGNLSGHKVPPPSNQTVSSWLHFTQNRQSLPNYPDIVDNETYFQPVNSDSVNDLTPSQNSTSEFNPEAGFNGSGHSPSHHVGEDRRVVSQLESSPPDMSGAPQLPLYPSLPQDPALPVSPNSGTRQVQIPTYRQIQTRDISVGVSARIDPQRADTLPDLLHSHVASPVTPSRPNQHRQTRNGDRRNRPPDHRTRNQGRHRTHETGTRTTRHGRRNRTRSSSSIHSDEGACKEPCVKCFVKLTSFRWVLVVLSLLGVCCVVTGIVLAALHAAGNSFLFLAIMFIGLGVLLVIVVGVGWKCTPRGHEPLHALFNIGDFRRRRDRQTRRAYRQRDSNWYGGVMYPEFQYRRPPPSYAASMQEYQQQLLLAQQQYLQQTGSNGESLPNSPPPSYRSRTSTIHSGIHIAFPPDSDQPNSRPPTYRSTASTMGRRGPVRPPLPRDHSYDDDRGDNLPGGDISFAGPDVSPTSVGSEVGQSSEPTSASIDRTPSDDSILSASSPSDLVTGRSSSVASPETPSSAASLSSAHNQTTVTNPEQSSVIQGQSSSVSGGTNGSITTNVDESSSHVQPKDDTLDRELQQTLETFDEITSGAVSDSVSKSMEEATSSEEPERFQTAL
ncbi:uncharacterized protein [Haliotis cracherodii]|uniref:uncharacterized protein n=1 Tax=Haliotis cracherodii TaxID=6455 RepID=UPI0039E964BA